MTYKFQKATAIYSKTTSRASTGLKWPKTLHRSKFMKLKLDITITGDDTQALLEALQVELEGE